MPKASQKYIYIRNLHEDEELENISSEEKKIITKSVEVIDTLLQSFVFRKYHPLKMTSSIKRQLCSILLRLGTFPICSGEKNSSFKQ